MSYSSLPEITVRELARQIAENAELVQLIDVREPEEVSIAFIENFTILPLSQFALWSEKITTRFDPEVETIVMCHHGIRSAQMCQWLLSQGFIKVKNVSGGIDAYSVIVDRTVPRY